MNAAATFAALLAFFALGAGVGYWMRDADGELTRLFGRIVKLVTTVVVSIMGMAAATLGGDVEWGMIFATVVLSVIGVICVAGAILHGRGQ